jgi:uncharacterized protein
MEWAAAYLALGAVTGVLAGLFGIGGGLLLVPALLFSFAAQGFSSAHLLHLALASAMASILFSSLASLRKHHQHGAVDWRVVRRISPGILLGTALGAAFSAHIPAQFLGIFFALFVYLAAAQILLDIRPHAARQLPQRTGMTLFGMFTGWISSLVSIGGGTLVIPFLIWCNVPLRRAIGTSAAIGFPVALGGTLGYIVTGLNQPNLPSPHLGYVYLPAVFWVAFASVFTAPLGAKLAHRMDVGLLRKLFALLLIGLATKLWLHFW